MLLHRYERISLGREQVLSLKQKQRANIAKRAPLAAPEIARHPNEKQLKAMRRM